MPGYPRTTWVDRVTPVSAANLNNMEAGIWLATGLFADFCLDTNVNIASGPASPFDGVSYALSPVGLRFLLIGQTDSTQNGLWQHNGVGNAMTRPAEFPAGLVVPDGLQIDVKQGRVYGGWTFIVNNGRVDAAATATVGTNAISFIAAIPGWTPGDVKWTSRKIAADPVGWLIGDGRALVAATPYTALRAALVADGNPYGVDGSGNPLLPDPRSRGLIGAGAGAGLTARNVGDKGGEETHTLAVSEIPAHAHAFLYRDQVAGSGLGSNDPQIRLDAPNNVTIPPGNAQNPIGSDINSGNQGHAHNNMQPWLALTLLIKA